MFGPGLKSCCGEIEMSRHRDWDVACKVYIGNLGNNASKYELEDAFSKYGPLKNVWVARNPPGFAFGKDNMKISR